MIFLNLLIVHQLFSLIFCLDQDNNNTLSVNETTTTTTTLNSTFNQLSLAYGFLLDTECKTDDDCLIKNSICNTLTKRCGCDFNAIHKDNRCRILQCRTSEDCSLHFSNTICVFGSCRCRWGLKSNGKCVDLDVPVIGSQTLPDWAISLIAVVALLSGIFGARSPFIAQLSRQLLSMLVLILGRFANNRINNNNSDNQANQQTNPQQQLLKELQTAMIQQSVNQQNQQQNDLNQQRKLSTVAVIDELVSSLVQQQQKQQNQQQQRKLSILNQ